MNPGIFLINDKDELVEMSEQGYDSEKRLQDWLSKHPSLLVGNQIVVPRCSGLGGSGRSGSGLPGVGSLR